MTDPGAAFCRWRGAALSPGRTPDGVAVPERTSPWLRKMLGAIGLDVAVASDIFAEGTNGLSRETRRFSRSSILKGSRFLAEGERMASKISALPCDSRTVELLPLTESAAVEFAAAMRDSDAGVPLAGVPPSIAIERLKALSIDDVRVTPSDPDRDIRVAGGRLSFGKSTADPKSVSDPTSCNFRSRATTAVSLAATASSRLTSSASRRFRSACN